MTTTANYVLTAAQFDSLASGYGTPDAVRILCDGQLAKRKLLLQALMQRHLGSPAVELLLHAEEKARESTTEVLRHPHLDAWATQALRTPGDLGYLAQVAAGAAVRAGLPFSIEVPVTHGEVYLPSLGAATVDGTRTTVVGSANGEVRIGQVRLGGAGWSAARTVQLEPEFGLAIEDQEPFRDTYHWRPAPRLDADTADRFAELLRLAWRILVERHPEHAEAMRVLLRVVVPLAAPRSGGIVSAASRQASGSVAVVIPATAEELSLLLLHEFMHMKLDALRDLVDLHAPESRGRYLAPWRMDPRPVGALMQGIYAHTGVIDYWRRRRRLHPGSPPVADVEFAYWRRQNWLAIASLAASEELTPYGESFVQGLYGTLASWQHEEIPANTAARAEAMVEAQTVRWRMRNLRPAEAELAAVLNAWRLGLPPGPIESAGMLRADSEGEPSGMPGIVGAIRSALAGAKVATDAEIAYLDDDLALAAALYGARLNEDDGDDDWVGFAMAAGDGPLGQLLRMRPDLVRAVVRTLRSQRETAEVTAVAEWIANGNSFGS